MTEVTETKKYELLVACEACGQPLKLVSIEDDNWIAACSDPQCAALHRGN